MTGFANRRVTIIGMAREGMALARFMVRQGARVLISDRRGLADLADEVGQLAGLPITCVLRGHPPDILEADVLFLSPGVPRQAEIVHQAKARGVPLSSATELFFELCRAPIIGITGSSGKTTTTSLTGDILKAGRRRKVWVGGNIGQPLIEFVEEIRPSDWVVLELSSFQLEPLRQSPHVAVVTNLRPNHLDRHGTFEAYTAAKANILRHQSADDVAVLNWDDPHVRALAGLTQARVLWFSRRHEVPEGTFLADGWVVSQVEGQRARICRLSEIPLPGDHNVENVLAAVCVARAVGVSRSAIARAVATFKGVPHRLEVVREVDGVTWINDSIATSPDRTVAALRAFEQHKGRIILLAGGRDKHLPLDEMAGEILTRVKHLVLFGEMAPLVERAVRAAAFQRESPSITRCHTLEEAVAVAADVARSGDLVLLSPGGTSFDAFKDFEARGERFKELVRHLPSRHEETSNGRLLRVATG